MRQRVKHLNAHQQWKIKTPLSSRFKKSEPLQNALFMSTAIMMSSQNDYSIEDCDYDSNPHKKYLISEDCDYDRNPHKMISRRNMHYLWSLRSWSQSSQNCHVTESLYDCDHDCYMYKKNLYLRLYENCDYDHSYHKMLYFFVLWGLWT